MRNIALFAAILFSGNIFAADSTLRYENYVYEKEIKSVQLLQSASGFNFPVLSLGAGESLTLDFDQMVSERDYYQYTLIHCNADWTPSELQKTQYLNGMGFENIENATFSTGTLMQYTHYNVIVPGQNTVPRISGNYLLLVYRNFDEKDIILTRRIMVTDLKGNIDMNLIQSSQVDLRATHQEVDFNFTLNNGYFIPNPYKDLTAVILRNGDWNSAISNLPPQFITGNTYNYQYQTGNQFEGLNEYRFFDIRSYRMSTANVKQRFAVSNQKHIILVTEQNRRYDQYMNWIDYNGRYFLFSRDIPMPGGASSESDYCYVHFNLKAAEELKDKEIYVYGELSDWRIQYDYKMYYNADAGAYEAIIPLKQAYYNYQFAVVDKTTREMDLKYMEGSHGQTENNYMVLLYHKNQTMGYDELIGYGLKNSRSVK